jgi:pantoate--beta-alanine ligase
VTAAATQLRIVRSVDELRSTLDEQRHDGARVGFVPTMGALHDGHAELVRVARRECDLVVVSCYVNPTQFAAGEDLDRYPRTPEHDTRIAAAAGADVLWRPTDLDVYGDDPANSVRVQVGTIGTLLEGEARPGHFDGVATVVVRLLGAVSPDVLYLGEKDFQQVVVLRRVVRDLLMPVAIRAVPTVREPDGLARSSRNAYLTPTERATAAAIPRALDAAAEIVAAGERDAQRIVDACRGRLARTPALHIDYVRLVDATRLAPVARLGRDDAVLLVAARVGNTRLIDNLPIPATSEDRP